MFNLDYAPGDIVEVCKKGKVVEVTDEGVMVEYADGVKSLIVDLRQLALVDSVPPKFCCDFIGEATKRQRQKSKLVRFPPADQLTILSLLMSLLLAGKTPSSGVYPQQAEVYFSATVE